MCRIVATIGTFEHCYCLSIINDKTRMRAEQSITTSSQFIVNAHVSCNLIMLRQLFFPELLQAVEVRLPIVHDWLVLIILLEQVNRWIPLHLQEFGSVVFCRVELIHLDAIHLCLIGKSLEHRCESATVLTPRGVEVHECSVVRIEDLIVEGASSQYVNSIHSLCGSHGLSCRFSQLLQRLILEVSICQLLQSRDSQLEACRRSEHALPLLVLPAIHAHSRQIIWIVANRQCISDLWHLGCVDCEKDNSSCVPRGCTRFSYNLQV